MDEKLHTLDINKLDTLDTQCKELALASLESGQVIYFPSYSFSIQPSEESELLSDKILDGKHKNISFDYRNKRLGGYYQNNYRPHLSITLKAFMQRYADFAKDLIDTLLPQYQHALHWGRTSYRPAEIKGRSSSKRKDDTRLHVDAFPSTPVNGRRILRIFSNVNPFNEPRAWHLGEPFAEVIERFAPQIPAYNPALAKLLYWIKATKTLRSAYDHYQLNLHDRMKLDDAYQQSVTKSAMDFEAGSTWIVFTDEVSHAALSGQFLLEQTFYLPVEAMSNPDLSPFAHWERKKEAVFSV